MTLCRTKALLLIVFLSACGTSGDIALQGDNVSFNIRWGTPPATNTPIANGASAEEEQTAAQEADTANTADYSASAEAPRLDAAQ